MSDSAGHPQQQQQYANDTYFDYYGSSQQPGDPYGYQPYDPRATFAPQISSNVGRAGVAWDPWTPSLQRQQQQQQRTRSGETSIQIAGRASFDRTDPRVDLPPVVGSSSSSSHQSQNDARNDPSSPSARFDWTCADPSHDYGYNDSHYQPHSPYVPSAFQASAYTQLPPFSWETGPPRWGTSATSDHASASSSTTFTRSSVAHPLLFDPTAGSSSALCGPPDSSGRWDGGTNSTSSDLPIDANYYEHPDCTWNEFEQEWRAYLDRTDARLSTTASFRDSNDPYRTLRKMTSAPPTFADLDVSGHRRSSRPCLDCL